MTRELTVLRQALSQGLVSGPQLREALLLREALRQDGVAAPALRVVLRAVAPERRPGLERAWQQLRRDGDPADEPAAFTPWPDPLPPTATHRAREWALRPPAEDPPDVKTAVDALRSVRAPDEATRDGGSPAPRPLGRASSARLAGEQRIGPCRVLRELGRGGCGAVLLAHHERLDRQVAVKVLHGHDARALERFRTEARVMARLRHPNVVGVHEVGEQDGAPFLVMDFVDGETLHARLRREGAMEPHEAARIAARLARGLEAAHERSTLHRDLKPQNVLIDATGEPLLTDFGIARALDESRGLTRTGQMLGTIAYAAPEQVMGRHGEVDARSDVYGLGATLYEMLAGHPPFAGDMALNVIHQVTTSPPPPLRVARPELDPALEALCLRCLAKRPDERFPTAAALAEALEAWLSGAAARPVAAAAPRVPAAVLAGLALVAGALVGAGGHALLAGSPASARDPAATAAPPGGDAPPASVAPVGSAASLLAEARAAAAAGETGAAADALARGCDADLLESAVVAADLAPTLVEAAERALGAGGAGEVARARRLLVRARELGPDLDLSAAVARLDAAAAAPDAALASAACPWLGAAPPGEAEWARRLLGTPFTSVELTAARTVDRATWPTRLSILWRACDSWSRPEDAFDTALLWRPEAAALWWGRARLAQERGDFARAARLLDVAISREDHGELRHQRARLERLRPGGTLAGALALARATLAADLARGEDTAWPWHQMHLAGLLTDQGGPEDLAEARALLELLVEVRGFVHPLAFGMLSRVHALLGEAGEPIRRAQERRDSLLDHRYRNHGDR